MSNLSHEKSVRLAQLEEIDTRIKSHEVELLKLEKESNSLAKNLIAPIIIGLTVALFFNYISPKQDYVSSVELKSSILIAALHEAKLDVVRKIYDNRAQLDHGFFDFLNEKTPTYPYETPLSSILQDIKVDLYTSKDAPKPKHVETIDRLISAHDQKNPFDKLTPPQKEYFENVRQKSGEAYKQIQSDMNNISDELDTQNTLVTTYLGDSQTSLYVSIFSLLIAVIISSYQIYQGRSKRTDGILRTLIDGASITSKLDSPVPAREDPSEKTTPS
ncbi:MAG: hypothetical protein JKY93_02080 [Gammaproteobacteria bacterium]|nr:hypothetical protein [Gammaproteobacteria bacterium]